MYKKPRRLSSFDVSKFLVKNKLKIRKELLAKANTQKCAGRTDLVNFVLLRSSKSGNSLIKNIWAKKAAVKAAGCSDISCMESIRSCASLECVTGCNGMWLTMAKEGRRNNHIHEIAFVSVLPELLEKGKRKHQNVMLIRPKNEDIFLRSFEQGFWNFCKPYS